MSPLDHMATTPYIDWHIDAKCNVLCLCGVFSRPQGVVDRGDSTPIELE